MGLGIAGDRGYGGDIQVQLATFWDSAAGISTIDISTTETYFRRICFIGKRHSPFRRDVA